MSKPSPSLSEILGKLHGCDEDCTGMYLTVDCQYVTEAKAAIIKLFREALKFHADNKQVEEILSRLEKLA